jgi:NADPH2:quinone reductase
MLTPALANLRKAQLHQSHILKQSSPWFEQGQLKIHVSQTFPLEQAALAHRAIESGSTTGKIVLNIDS